MIINLTNYKKTSLHKTFEEVRKQARKRGLRVTGSEIVGLVPKQSILDAISAMRKEIAESKDKVNESLNRVINERTKEGDTVIIVGVGNTVGVAQ